MGAGTSTSQSSSSSSSSGVVRKHTTVDLSLTHSPSSSSSSTATGFTKKIDVLVSTDLFFTQLAIRAHTHSPVLETRRVYVPIVTTASDLTKDLLNNAKLFYVGDPKLILFDRGEVTEYNDDAKSKPLSGPPLQFVPMEDELTPEQQLCANILTRDHSLRWNTLYKWMYAQLHPRSPLAVSLLKGWRDRLDAAEPEILSILETLTALARESKSATPGKKAVEQINRLQSLHIDGDYQWCEAGFQLSYLRSFLNAETTVRGEHVDLLLRQYTTIANQAIIQEEDKKKERDSPHLRFIAVPHHVVEFIFTGQLFTNRELTKRLRQYGYLYKGEVERQMREKDNHVSYLLVFLLPRLRNHRRSRQFPTGWTLYTVVTLMLEEREDDYNLKHGATLYYEPVAEGNDPDRITIGWDLSLFYKAFLSTAIPQARFKAEDDSSLWSTFTSITLKDPVQRQEVSPEAEEAFHLSSGLWVLQMARHITGWRTEEIDRATKKSKQLREHITSEKKFQFPLIDRDRTHAIRYARLRSIDDILKVEKPFVLRAKTAMEVVGRLDRQPAVAQCVMNLEPREKVPVFPYFDDAVSKYTLWRNDEGELVTLHTAMEAKNTKNLWQMIEKITKELPPRDRAILVDLDTRTPIFPEDRALLVEHLVNHPDQPVPVIYELDGFFLEEMGYYRDGKTPRAVDPKSTVSNVRFRDSLSIMATSSSSSSISSSEGKIEAKTKARVRIEDARMLKVGTKVLFWFDTKSRDMFEAEIVKKLTDDDNNNNLYVIRFLHGENKRHYTVRGSLIVPKEPPSKPGAVGSIVFASSGEEGWYKPFLGTITTATRKGGGGGGDEFTYDIASDADGKVHIAVESKLVTPMTPLESLSVSQQIAAAATDSSSSLLPESPYVVSVKLAEKGYAILPPRWFEFTGYELEDTESFIRDMTRPKESKEEKREPESGRSTVSLLDRISPPSPSQLVVARFLNALLAPKRPLAQVIHMRLPSPPEMKEKERLYIQSVTLVTTPPGTPTEVTPAVLQAASVIPYGTELTIVIAMPGGGAPSLRKILNQYEKGRERIVSIVNSSSSSSSPFESKYIPADTRALLFDSYIPVWDLANGSSSVPRHELVIRVRTKNNPFAMDFPFRVEPPQPVTVDPTTAFPPRVPVSQPLSVAQILKANDFHNWKDLVEKLDENGVGKSSVSPDTPSLFQQAMDLTVQINGKEYPWGQVSYADTSGEWKADLQSAEHDDVILLDAETEEVLNKTSLYRVAVLWQTAGAGQVDTMSVTKDSLRVVAKELKINMTPRPKESTPVTAYDMYHSVPRNAQEKVEALVQYAHERWTPIEVDMGYDSPFSRILNERVFIMPNHPPHLDGVLAAAEQLQYVKSKLQSYSQELASGPMLFAVFETSKAPRLLFPYDRDGYIRLLAYRRANQKAPLYLITAAKMAEFVTDLYQKRV